MGHCPQSNHHRSYRHSGSFRSGRLQIAMRTITLLIVHCSATPQGVALGFEDCRRDHIHHRGFRDIGEQKASLLALLRELKRIFPRALIVGHHNLNPTKACPCFDAEREYRGL